MAIFSSTNLLTAFSLLHLTIAYYLLTTPQTLVDQNLVYIMGEAMGIPPSTKFANRSGPSAFLAAVFAFLAMTDMVAVGLPEEIYHYHWGNQAPMRLIFFFGLTAYTYVSSLSNTSASADANLKNSASTVLSNSMVFTWAFVEMINWFWIFYTLRDERRQLAVKLAGKRKSEEERAQYGQ